MSNTEFAPWPHYSEEEADKAREILLSGKVNYWTGNETRSFETEFAEYCGAAYAVALTNGTVALELALKALDLEPGSEIIVTPRTFFATASAIVTNGLRPVFADIDPESQNITAETIAAVASSATRAVICVHLAGQPCDMDPILKLSRSRNWKVIEDCAQAHGARYKGKSVGTLGDVGCWSFCQDKIISTAGEGGMITTNDRKLYESIWSYKDHGKTLESVYEKVHAPGFRWLHEGFGTNARMTEIQGAIGRIQLRKLDGWVQRRRTISNQIRSVAAKLPGLRVPVILRDAEHAFYRCYLFVEMAALHPGWNRDLIKERISAKGVPCFEGSCSEVYLESAFRAMPVSNIRLPVARRLGETSLAFLVHPTLTQNDILLTLEALQSVMIEAGSRASVE
ncbi:MAG: aminotransferase [Leptospiraceae bacterium]|nr:aminotransferase [Leptospiraceae bacterium]